MGIYTQNQSALSTSLFRFQTALISIYSLRFTTTRRPIMASNLRMWMARHFPGSSSSTLPLFCYIYSPSFGIPELVVYKLVIPTMRLEESLGTWWGVGPWRGNPCTEGEGKGKKGGEACILIVHGKDSWLESCMCAQSETWIPCADGRLARFLIVRTQFRSISGMIE